MCVNMSKNKQEECTMARPRTKQELLIVAEENYNKLIKQIESMSELELQTDYDFSS